jgi:hypothetical protein
MIEKKIREKIKNKEYINWSYICYSEKLSEEFIREFSDKVNWYYISWRHKLSEEFIIEFANEIYFKYIPVCRFNLNNKRLWESFI